jgi:uncharacterized protein (TIGR00369 family)
LLFSLHKISFSSMAENPHSPADTHSTGQLTPSADGDYSASLNAACDGWNKAMDIRYVRATGDEVIAELTVAHIHHQAYGIVHGGVYCGLIETVSSVGAALWAGRTRHAVVGLENQTSFLNAVREGTLRATARPLMRGRRTQVWEATVTDSKGRSVASGRVRLLALEPGSAIAGEAVKVKARER